VTVVYAKQALGSKQVRSLTPTDVAAFLDYLASEGVGATTARKHLRVLSACLNEARRQGYAPRNPVADLHPSQKPRAVKQEAAYLTDAEIPKLLSATPPGVYRVLFETALVTGCREGELVALQWGDVEHGTVPDVIPERDEEKPSTGVIHVRRSRTNGVVGTTKSGETRDVAIPADLVRSLAAWWDELGKPGNKTLVFPAASRSGYLEPKQILRALYGAMDKAGITRECPEGKARGVKRTFHSFRHTHARMFLEQGRPLYSLSLRLGHSGVQVTERYAHWASEAAREEAAALEGVLGVY
jgi:integrase